MLKHNDSFLISLDEFLVRFADGLPFDMGNLSSNSKRPEHGPEFYEEESLQSFLDKNIDKDHCYKWDGLKWQWCPIRELHGEPSVIFPGVYIYTALDGRIAVETESHYDSYVTVFDSIDHFQKYILSVTKRYLND